MLYYSVEKVIFETSKEITRYNISFLSSYTC